MSDCSACGASIEPGAKTCPACGTATSALTPVTPASSAAGGAGRLRISQQSPTAPGQGPKAAPGQSGGPRPSGGAANGPLAPVAPAPGGPTTGTHRANPAAAATPPAPVEPAAVLVDRSDPGLDPASPAPPATAAADPEPAKPRRGRRKAAAAAPAVAAPAVAAPPLAPPADDYTLMGRSLDPHSPPPGLAAPTSGQAPPPGRRNLLVVAMVAGGAALLLLAVLITVLVLPGDERAEDPANVSTVATAAPTTTTTPELKFTSGAVLEEGGKLDVAVWYGGDTSKVKQTQLLVNGQIVKGVDGFAAQLSHDLATAGPLQTKVRIVRADGDDLESVVQVLNVTATTTTTAPPVVVTETTIVYRDRPTTTVEPPRYSGDTRYGTVDGYQGSAYIRSGPTPDADTVREVRDGTRIRVYCYTFGKVYKAEGKGESRLWVSTDGGWIWGPHVNYSGIDECGD